MLQNSIALAPPNNQAARAGSRASSIGHRPLLLHELVDRMAALRVEKLRNKASFFAKVQAVIQADPNSVKAVLPATGQTPLLACLSRQAGDVLQELAFLLVQCGANVNHADKAGNTALHIIIKEGKDEGAFNTVRMLLEKGANPNVCNMAGLTPLMIVCRHQRGEAALALLRMLIEQFQADPNLQNPRDGSRALDNCGVDGGSFLATHYLVTTGCMGGAQIPARLPALAQNWRPIIRPERLSIEEFLLRYSTMKPFHTIIGDMMVNHLEDNMDQIKAGVVERIVNEGGDYVEDATVEVNTNRDMVEKFANIYANDMIEGPHAAMRFLWAVSPAIPEIWEKGFNNNHKSVLFNKYGLGLYFFTDFKHSLYYATTDPQKSTRWPSLEDGSYELLLCGVSFGRAGVRSPIGELEYNENEDHPADIRLGAHSTPPKGCVSAAGRYRKEVVMYEPNRCLPLFRIRFKPKDMALSRPYERDYLEGYRYLQPLENVPVLFPCGFEGELIVDESALLNGQNIVESRKDQLGFESLVYNQMTGLVRIHGLQQNGTAHQCGISEGDIVTKVFLSGVLYEPTAQLGETFCPITQAYREAGLDEICRIHCSAPEHYTDAKHRLPFEPPASPGENDSVIVSRQGLEFLETQNSRLQRKLMLLSQARDGLLEIHDKLQHFQQMAMETQEALQNEVGAHQQTRQAMMQAKKDARKSNKRVQKLEGKLSAMNVEFEEIRHNQSMAIQNNKHMGISRRLSAEEVAEETKQILKDKDREISSLKQEKASLIEMINLNENEDDDATAAAHKKLIKAKDIEITRLSSELDRVIAEKNKEMDELRTKHRELVMQQEGQIRSLKKKVNKLLKDVLWKEDLKQENQVLRSRLGLGAEETIHTGKKLTEGGEDTDDLPLAKLAAQRSEELNTTTLRSGPSREVQARNRPHAHHHTRDEHHQSRIKEDRHHHDRNQHPRQPEHTRRTSSQRLENPNSPLRRGRPLAARRDSSASSGDEEDEWRRSRDPSPPGRHANRHYRDADDQDEQKQEPDPNYDPDKPSGPVARTNADSPTKPKSLLTSKPVPPKPDPAVDEVLAGAVPRDGLGGIPEDSAPLPPIIFTKDRLAKPKTRARSESQRLLEADWENAEDGPSNQNSRANSDDESQTETESQSVPAPGPQRRKPLTPEVDSTESEPEDEMPAARVYDEPKQEEEEEEEVEEPAKPASVGNRRDTSPPAEEPNTSCAPEPPAEDPESSPDIDLATLAKDHAKQKREQAERERALSPKKPPVTNASDDPGSNSSSAGSATSPKPPKKKKSASPTTSSPNGGKLVRQNSSGKKKRGGGPRRSVSKGLAAKLAAFQNLGSEK